MISFDEEQMITDGKRIYDYRDTIEKIADQICIDGFQNICFSSVGGSHALLKPFEYIINEHSEIEVFSILSSEVVLTGHNRINNNTLVIMSSKSGDTEETVAGAEYFNNRGCKIISIVGEKNSKLEMLSDYCFVYENGRPQELVLYLLIGKILANKNYFDDYDEFANQLRLLPQVLVDVRKQANNQAIDYCKKYSDEPYNIWIGSGTLWPVCYSFSMCVLEESQWIRTKSVSSPEFFHGTLELVEEDVCCTLIIGEGKTREIDLRVKKFIQQYTNKANVFDCADYPYEGISDKFRPLLSPVVMNAILQRISKNMEVITEHPLETRRYYRKVEY